MKIHSTTERVNDVRMNWENPFLFYDPDNDGLTEMAIRYNLRRNPTGRYVSNSGG